MSEGKKKKIRKSTYVLIIAAAMALGAFGASLWCRQYDARGEMAAVASQNPTPAPTPTVTNASMFMVGDALLHADIPWDADTGGHNYDFSRILGHVGAIAKPYDLEYYNQETILGGDDLGIHGYPTFNGPQAWGDAMTGYGFNLVSLANNHSLDMGQTGLNNSLNYWKAKTDVVTSGVYASQAEREAIPVHEVNGIKYAFFSWTYGMNGLQCPAGQEYEVACYDGHEQEMLDQITAAKKQADVVIVAMHWGTEYVTDATSEQQRIGQELADAGADIIVGNHPHVIGPVQWLNNGKTICFYALGNLCSAQYDESRIEMMAALNIQKTTDNGQSTIKITNVKTDLMYQYYTNGFHNFEVIPFSQMSDDTYLAGHQAVYDDYKKIITSMDPSIQVGGF
jgi:poly-gamma-glutamate synthesis protein (capsule biosynthesis protein)